MHNIETISSIIFQKFGLSYQTATRAGGWTNAVYLNGDLALRLSTQKDTDRIRREVRLSQLLPKEIGYPVNIAVGVEDGYEWSLSKRIYAKNLSEVWGDLDGSQRIHAIEQIIRIMDRLHHMDIQQFQGLAGKRAWYSSFDQREVESCLESYRQKKLFTHMQIKELYRIFDDLWVKHRNAKQALNHGDITADNLLWQDGKIVSLMDFEHCVICPSAQDAQNLVNLALFCDEDYEHTILPSDDPQYKAAVFKLFKPLLAEPHTPALLLGYATLYRMRFLGFYLENPAGKLEEQGAYKKLLSIADGNGGYLIDNLNA